MKLKDEIEKMMESGKFNLLKFWAKALLQHLCCNYSSAHLLTIGDSFDLNTTEDINQAIEKFEKMLGTDVSNADSFKKIKEMQGSSGGFSDINDREIISKLTNSKDSSDEQYNQNEEEKVEYKNYTEYSTNPSENESDEDKFLNQWLYNTNFSFTQLLNKVDDEDEIERKRLKIIDKIKSICDIFTHYSYEDRNYYLEEMHLILRILKPEDIIEYVVPSFSIFVDEKDELKFKFLHQCLLVIEKICTNDFETAVDQIVINVLPHLESILRNTKDDLQETCMNTLSTKIIFFYFS